MPGDLSQSFRLGIVLELRSGPVGRTSPEQGHDPGSLDSPEGTRGSGRGAPGPTVDIILAAGEANPRNAELGPHRNVGEAQDMPL